LGCFLPGGMVVVVGWREEWLELGSLAARGVHERGVCRRSAAGRATHASIGAVLASPGHPTGCSPVRLLPTKLKG